MNTLKCMIQTIYTDQTIIITEYILLFCNFEIVTNNGIVFVMKFCQPYRNSKAGTFGENYLLNYYHIGKWTTCSRPSEPSCTLKWLVTN